MKSTTAERLKTIMQERGLKQVDILQLCKPLCLKYGVKLNKNDLSQYVNGKVIPKQDKLAILSEALHVNEPWLMGYDDVSKDDIFKYPNIKPVVKKRFPMLGSIACGEPIFADEDREHCVMVDMDIDADFCLTAKGDSMINARINDGDIVFIKEMPLVENGEIAAVIIGDEATLKRVYYYKEQNKLVLNPENPKYEPLVYVNSELDTIRILGKAVYFMSAL
ncbi:MAG: XRE family transcriptional regulator [Ruminococcus sp.]|nr:XRE family transcriptional regulator [Ruminococcus sp.]MBQ8119250.1 XRE family transcriptional regulator [Ruminococcus sp.]